MLLGLIVKILLVCLCLSLAWSSAHAEKATFKFLRTVTVAELNEILSTEREAFRQTAEMGAAYTLLPFSTASNDVDLYSVQYFSQSPDLGNGRRSLVSGLLALPKLANAGSVALMSYQHGTVWGKYEVPSYAFKTSNPDGYPHYAAAYETRYMVGLFAGNGYAVMAADYFGMGDGVRGDEAYMIKRSTAQVNYELYQDVRKFLSSRGVSISRLFLGGWSQGGLNTTGFLELLETRGVSVTATFTASAPIDPFASLNGVLYHPRTGDIPRDAPWINTILALTAFSCEKYMGSRDLARATIDPKYYRQFKTIYERSYERGAYPNALFDWLGQWYGTPNVDYLRPAFRDPAYFADSAYGKCLAANETYRQEFRTPLRMFYGSDDEVIRPRAGRLAYEYQETLVDKGDAASTNTIVPVLVEGADHRYTFITAAPAAKAWMDGLR